MSEIRDKARDDIDKIISELRRQFETEHYDFHYDYAVEARNKILALEKLAVVDRRAGLPRIFTSNAEEPKSILRYREELANYVLEIKE